MSTTDETGKTEAIYKELISLIEKKNFGEARSKVNEAFEASKIENKLIPEVLSKLILLTYIYRRRSEDFYVIFKRRVKEIPDFEENWETAKLIIVNDYLTLYRSISNYIKIDYFLIISPWKQVLETIQKEEMTVSTVNRLVLLCSTCSSDIARSTLTEIASAALAKINFLIYEKGEKKFNEKQLSKTIMFLKSYCGRDDQIILSKFEENLMFEYIVSDSLGKQFEALQSFNGFRGFSPETLQKLIDLKVVDHMLADMHQDIVPKFVSFFIKMWNHGEFHEEQLEAFWNLSINQHQTVIDKFFSQWPRIFNALPKDKKDVFWEIVISSKKYPQSALDFLIKLAGKQNEETKKRLVDSLMKVQMPDRLICVDTIYEYARTSYDMSQSIIAKAFDLINEKKEIDFAVLLLLKALKTPTHDMFETILQKAELPPSESQPLLDLIMKICETFKKPLPNSDVEQIKRIIEPIIEVNSASVSKFLNDLVQMKAISPDSTESLMMWLSTQKESMSDFIFSLFLKTNKIETGSFDSLELVGMQALLKLLFTSKEMKVSDFITDLCMRCKSTSSIVEMIHTILDNQLSIASLNVLCNLIVDNEMILNNPPQVNAYDYAPRVNIILDDKGTIAIPMGVSVDFFKKRVGAFLDRDYRELEFFIEDEPLENNHFFMDNEHITVKVPMFASGMRKWKPQQLPTAIMKKYDDKLFDIINEKSELSEPALRLLNLLPTISTENSIFLTKTPDWEKIFDIQKPFVLLYRLNILGNILKAKNRREISNFFMTGGFMHIMKILLEHREIFHAQSHVDLFMCIVNTLIVSCSTIDEANAKKHETYKELGIKVIVDSLVEWISALTPSERLMSVMVYSIVCILGDVSKDDYKPLLHNEHFTDLFESLIFDPRIPVQDALSYIVLAMDLEETEPIILSQLDKARNGNCAAYFNLVKKVANEGKDAANVWKLLGESLMKNMFLMSPNAVLPEDFGREEKYPEKKENKPEKEEQKENLQSNEIEKDNEETKETVGNENKEEKIEENKPDKEEPNVAEDNKETKETIDRENKEEKKETVSDESKEEEKHETNAENNEKEEKQEIISEKNEEEEKHEVVEQSKEQEEKHEEEQKEKEDDNHENVKEKQENEQKQEVEPKQTDEKEQEGETSKNKQEHQKPTFLEQKGETEETKEQVKQEEAKEEEDNILHPNGSFTVEELKEAALVMSAKLADPLFISCIFETLLNLIERVPNPIPNASELCLYALNKVAFNVSRFIDPPPTLFPLIEAIIKREPTVGPPVFERLKVLHSRFSPFRSSPIVDNKNNTYNYRKGLSNLGCTCYINASLQQLLRVPEVRDAILSYRPSGDINTDWLAQLQLLFAKLLYFPCKSINPSPFIRNFKTPDGRPINVSEQQDAVEFVQFVMASIDEKIPTKPIEHTMNGKIVHEIVSLDPEKEYKGITEENFSTFALEVRDITDIQESFKIFKIPDLFTGKNQYNADNIGLIDAERRHAVREAPDTLVFQLKRFDFDMNTFARIKLNSQFKFPLTLDISPILENPETCEYELQGIIMHSGSSEGGHYYSYIKDSDGWFLYNDSRVSQIEESTVMANATVTPKGNIFTQALSFSNRNASGYLLFYRKKLPSKPPVDPICRMPAKMISYLLEDMQALVFRNVIFSEEYQRFLRTAIANASCTETYEMAFAFHDIILSSNDGMKFLDPLVRVMLKKAMTDKGFADYVLCKSSAFQNIIAQPSSKVRSIYTNLAVCAISISDFAEQFVNQLVPCLDCAYDRMMFLDSIFRPIVAFIERDPKPMPDLLLKLMSIVTDQFGRLDSKIQKSVTTNSDLSGCFRAVRLLLERDKENAALLQQIIMNDEFKNDWSISDKHAFEFSNLLYTYLRDNEELTLQHINYVEKNMNRYHVTWFASHFAAACVVDDSLVKKRLDFFFKAASESKNISEIVPFFCQKICSTNSLTACKPLIQYRDYWVAKWISSSNKSVREWTSKIIFSLFPMFPVLERIPMEFGVIKEPLPEEKSDPVYVALVAELWEALMNANKQVIMSANSANNADIAVNYFNVLSWATFYSCKYQVVDRLYVAFEKNIEILSKLKRKDGIFSLLCFMRAYINNPFAFFSLPTLKAYLNALSRISSKNPDLIRKAMNIFLPMIDCIAGDYSNVIVSSSFMCDAIPLCFEGESLPQMTEFIKLVTTEESIESLCSILFKKINFQKALWQCNDAYLDAVERCLDFPRGVDLFIKSGAPVAIIEFVEDHATKKIYMQQIHGITLLIKTTQNVIENKKYVKKFFGDPLSPIIDVWMVSGDFMKLVFQEIQDSSCPLQLSAKIAELLTIVFGSLHKFTSAGINLIAASENDVYSLLEPSIRLIIAKLRTTLITRYSLQKKDSSSLLICDMERMISVYLYDSFVFTVYANSILSCNVKFPSSRICNILKSFFTGTSDLLVFDSPISMLLSMCSNEIKAEDEDVMAKRCYDLVAQLCCEGEEFKEISSTEKVGEIISKLKAAVSFLKNLRSTCGRAPEIKGGQRILSVFCSNKDIMEMIQFIGSFGID